MMATQNLPAQPAEGKASVQFISFQSQQVRTFTENGETWFSVVDVCRVLSISYHGKTLARFPAEWKRIHDRLAYISESAVYRLVFRSKKPEAIALANHIASEVLPAIRKAEKHDTKPTQAVLQDAPKTLPPAVDPAVERREEAFKAWNKLCQEYRRMDDELHNLRMKFHDATWALLYALPVAMLDGPRAQVSLLSDLLRAHGFMAASMSGAMLNVDIAMRYHSNG